MSNNIFVIIFIFNKISLLFFIIKYCYVLYLFTLAITATTFMGNWVTGYGSRGSSSSVRWRAATAPATFLATSRLTAGKREPLAECNIAVATSAAVQILNIEPFVDFFFFSFYCQYRVKLLFILAKEWNFTFRMHFFLPVSWRILVMIFDNGIKRF